MLRIPGQVIKATGELQRSAGCSSGLRQPGSADRLTGFEQLISALPGFKPGAKQQFEGKLRRFVCVPGVVQPYHEALGTGGWARSNPHAGAGADRKAPSREKNKFRLQNLLISPRVVVLPKFHVSTGVADMWHFYTCVPKPKIQPTMSISGSFRWIFAPLVAVPLKFQRSFLLLLGQNSRIITWSPTFESRPKPFLRAKYQNSTEISKRGKIYVKLSEIWIYLPTYLSRLWKKQRRAGRSSKRWFGSDDLILLLLPWCMKSDRLIWDASKIKESTSNKPKAQ